MGGVGELGNWVAGDVWCVGVRGVCGVRVWVEAGNGESVLWCKCGGGDGG